MGQKGLRIMISWCISSKCINEMSRILKDNQYMMMMERQPDVTAQLVALRSSRYFFRRSVEFCLSKSYEVGEKAKRRLICAMKNPLLPPPLELWLSLP